MRNNRNNGSEQWQRTVMETAMETAMETLTAGATTRQAFWPGVRILSGPPENLPVDVVL